jgi:D-alanyl-D-alanine dipeptidase
MKRTIIVLMFILSFIEAKMLPENFVYIKNEIPNIVEDIRYYGENNFVGSRINGYIAPRAIFTREATDALKKVQRELNSFGLGLKVFDSYRPQKAVDHFVRWGKDLKDTKMKKEYYPTVDKKSLFKEGYIAKKSGHSRGSTIDLTIIDLENGTELDMGSRFDFFSKKSWVRYKNITPQQRGNRVLIHTIMVRYGFKSYAEEWWHFTLKNEPYSDKYFNFDVK